MQLELDEAKVKELDNKFAEALRTQMHDQAGGYLNRQGGEAVNLHQFARDLVTKTADVFGQELKTQQQQAMWQAVANRRVQSAMEQIDVHAARQGMVYREGQTVARVKTGVDDAVANWASGDAPGSAYSMARATAMSEVEALAGMRGYSSEQTAQLRQETLTSMHGSVLNNMISLGATKQATEYLDKNIKEIDPDKVDDLRNLVKQSSVKDESLRLSMSLNGSLAQKRKTLQEMFQKGEISADVFDATTTRAEHDYQVQKAQQAEWEKSLVGQAQDYLIKHPEATVQDLPPQMYRGLVNSGHIGTIASFARSGRFDTDPKTWASIVGMPQAELARMTPTDFYNIYRGKLDDAHLEKGYALLAAAHGDVSDPKHLDILGTADRVKGAAVKLGIIDATGKQSDDQAVAFHNFEQQIDQRVRVFEATTLGGKRKASGDELQQIIDRATLETVWTPATFFSGAKQQPLVTMDPDDLKNAYVVVGGERIGVATIPPAQRAAITDKLMSRGLPVTEQTIASLWVQAGKPN